MAIEGPLKELGIHDVFQLLDLNRKTGVIRVTSELRHNQGTVWFQNGSVVYAEIRSNPHPLGDLLVRAGTITDADLNRARAMQKQGDGRKIGDILVAIGAMSQSDLERQVKFQIEEVIFEMMSWREGYFSFVEEPVSEVPGDAMSRVRIESLLMEGARRIDEWSRMERKIPHVGVVPALAGSKEREEGVIDLLPTEWEVLASIDGQRDIRALASTLARSEFDVAKTIFGLESAGVLTILPRPSGQHAIIETGKDVNQIVTEAERALEGHDVEGARSAVEAGIATYPHEPRLYVVKGKIQLACEQNGEAEESLRRALRLDSLLAPAHRMLGDALARQGRLAEAVGWWGRWLNLARETGEGESDVAAVMEVMEAAKTMTRFLKASRD